MSYGAGRRAWTPAPSRTPGSTHGRTRGTRTWPPDDVRGPAELAEWERIDQLLAAAPTGAVYNPDTDDFVRAELAAAAAREAELREAARVTARADELQALRELGALEQTEPRTGDEAARDELTRRAGGYVQADVDGWLAHALAAHLGHYRDPAACEEATGLLPLPVLAHAARCSPNSPARSPASTSTSWRSRPGSPPPNPKLPARLPSSLPAPVPGTADPGRNRVPCHPTLTDASACSSCPGALVEFRRSGFAPGAAAGKMGRRGSSSCEETHGCGRGRCDKRFSRGSGRRRGSLLWPPSGGAASTAR